MKTIRAVLFDLDGTLLDTAPDLGFALNELRRAHHLDAIPLSVFRPIAGLGTRALLKLAFDIEERDPNYANLREDFLALYQKHLADTTKFFPHIETVLTHLDQQEIPWGIVTNKHSQFTTKLLKALHFDHRPLCVIAGDSLPTFKPHPAPILHACELLKQHPSNCVYIGDTAIDVTASKAAGTVSLVALYGYIAEEENPYAWQADGYVKEPLEIIDWLPS